MIRAAEAEKIILSNTKDYGTECIAFDRSLGRVLAEDIVCDRDLPPYNRVTMDGIAISYAAFENGCRAFRIKATQAAGDVPVEISNGEECIEIMTGAALPDSTDTVIRYEDVAIKEGIATVITDAVKKGQSVHLKGVDKKQNEIVVSKGRFISPAIINMAASVGKTVLSVKKLPRVVIISTGNELVEADKQPTPYEVRRSNNYAVSTVLQQYEIEAEMLHIPDSPRNIEEQLKNCLENNDVIILSGGISKGKFDHVPEVLESLSVNKLFHGVKQRPGKPFWFGAHPKGTLAFALPGNPVSTFMCLHRYFLPWLKASLGVENEAKFYAALGEDLSFNPPLQYFLQVKLSVSDKGQILATPVEGNGSGDFSNLLEADAFMELPAENDNFKKGEVFRVWPFSRFV